MQRYAIGIEFCGTQYRGWQTQQAGVASVQETIEKVLSTIADHPIILHGAGRTDAGVHATNMVAHFDTTAIRPDRGWLMGTNSQLPKDISLQWIKRMDESFHARFKARARRYRYIVYNAPTRPALLYKQVTHLYQTLDVQKMIAAAAKFEGTHNFETFRAAACQSNQPVRHVKHCRLFEHGRYLVLDIQADGFLHHMVRNIMGCLLEIGQGMYEIDHIDHMFAAQDRKAAGITAPADGLYFIQAEYPEQFDLPQSPLGPHWLNLPE
ncbi:tRNA pseudouridine synthase A [Acinetobacter haemolyticus ATCC 19194]|uniref:tRNA pseudouridine synthase A n=1 Tax=Acinetobacter haemolyticus ATCC 19194 TaxID=707232 RepID=D4XM96_ACIHA|nr:MULTISPECIES: tRNA pseudouridine(38-40) synthase TruA [Acinetobacter]EEH69852.1 tRNA pseudouridine synthase A [Acinetobacter sp. ATCC 27244]EFF83672.1 tRNA pseudouridine synthase A [Acinetobacter haemolyticus ATCC 19194]NAS00235.1 tRNA pseudouridine(38-40) synthase TruA [Acinetobacter haemolyticus]QHI24075.1 tRNA pseudouridine(38-40) synthase TruA [Acinetobacter haemolyticus]